MKIAVIGAGSWGTATACLLGKQQNDISLWALEPEVAEGINSSRKNPIYVSDLYVPPAVKATNDMEEALHGAEIVVLVVVSHVMREVIEKAKPFIDERAVVISQTKGIENGSFMRMSQVVEDVMGPAVHDRLAVLSGPNHAEEVGREIPSATVIAAHDAGVAKMLQETYMSKYFRVYTNPDMIGVEFAGATKNVVALSAGMSDGLGYGDNSKASLLTRGLAEATRLGTALGGHAATFSGLAGVGDMVVTCFSRHSRNRLVGERLAKGQTVKEIYDDIHMVAEGVETSRALRGLSEKTGVVMPITHHVYEVLYEGRKPADIVLELMTRSAKEEHPDNN